MIAQPIGRQTDRWRIGLAVFAHRFRNRGATSAIAAVASKQVTDEIGVTRLVFGMNQSLDGYLGDLAVGLLDHPAFPTWS
jgi:hypothetical protein